MLGIESILMIWLVGEISEPHMCVDDVVTGSQEETFRGGARMD
jgi:hypothetical protein